MCGDPDRENGASAPLPFLRGRAPPLEKTPRLLQGLHRRLGRGPLQLFQCCGSVLCARPRLAGRVFWFLTKRASLPPAPTDLIRPRRASSRCDGDITLSGGHLSLSLSLAAAASVTKKTVPVSRPTEQGAPTEGLQWNGVPTRRKREKLDRSPPISGGVFVGK